MDKASIVGDAVSYVQKLQEQAKKLKAEIEGLETSLMASENYQGSSVENLKNFQDNLINYPICKKIMQVCLVKVLCQLQKIFFS